MWNITNELSKEVSCPWNELRARVKYAYIPSINLESLKLSLPPEEQSQFMILYRCIEQQLGELAQKSLMYADEPICQGQGAEAEELPDLVESVVSTYTSILVNLIANLEDEEIAAVRNVSREIYDYYSKAIK